jgi:hypothetical protein
MGSPEGLATESARVIEARGSQLLTLKQAAAYALCTTRFLQKQISLGKLHALKPSRKLVRIRGAELRRISGVWTTDCVKNSTAYSLQAAQAVAQYGKAARHPLCQAALELWRMEEELSGLMKQNALVVELVCNARQQKKQAQALVEQLRKEGKGSEAKEATALLRNIDKHLLKTQQCLQATTKGISVHLKLHGMAVARFGWEYNAAGANALRALPRVRQRWEALNNGARPKDGDARELGLLKLLRDKKIKAEWAKGGPTAGFWEAAAGGDRLLSDEVWSGRLTVQEIRSHLEATYGPGVAGDKYGKEIRRTLKTLRIRPAEDQRGRKWKPPPPKQKPKPRGRPRSEITLHFHEDLKPVIDARVRKYLHGDGLTKAEQNFALVQEAKKESESIDRQIARLTRRREKLGIEAPKPKPQGMIKDRTEKFAAFLDSD